MARSACGPTEACAGLVFAYILTFFYRKYCKAPETL